MKINLTFRKSLYVGISFLAIYLLVLLLLKNLPQLAAVFSYTMLIILYLAVVLSLYLASKASRIYGKRTQIAWIFLTFAVLTSVLGSVLWAVVMVYYNQNPTYSL